MRPRSVRIALVLVLWVLQIGCGGTQQPPLQLQAKSAFFQTHEVFYLSPLIDGSLYRSTQIYGYQIAKSSGIVTPVPGSPYAMADGTTGQTMSVGPVDPAHRFLLAARDLGYGNGAEIELFTISAEDGSLVLSSTATVPRLVMGLTFDSTGRFVYASVDSLSGNSIFSYRIDGARLAKIAETPVPFQADFPKAIANPRKPLLHVYGTTFVQTGLLDGYWIQHITTFHIDGGTGALTPTEHTYFGRDLPFVIAGIDGPGNFLFGEDIFRLREFALHDDGSIDELSSNALQVENDLGTGVFRVLGNPSTNVLYINTWGTYRECAITLANYDANTGAMSLSHPSQTNCHDDVQLAEATSDFLFGTNTAYTSLDPRTAVVIYSLDQSGTIIGQSYFPVF
jgi:hypothetical protein